MKFLRVATVKASHGSRTAIVTPRSSLMERREEMHLEGGSKRRDVRTHKGRQIYLDEVSTLGHSGLQLCVCMCVLNYAVRECLLAPAVSRYQAEAMVVRNRPV
jgi:hypothetical protein